jgi:gliding motility-associated-like protein
MNMVLKLNPRILKLAVLGVILSLYSGNITPLLAQFPLKWDKTMGGDRYEELNAIQPAHGGIVLGGSSNTNFSFGQPGDFSYNMWVAGLDPDGQLLWEYVYGGDQDERLWELIQTADGGFLAGGYSLSGANGDKSEPSRGDMDVWIIKLDAQGQLEWDRTFGGAGRDELFAILERPGGGYWLGCHSTSDASGDKTEDSRGGQDLWLLQLDADGQLEWDETIGGDNFDQIHDLEWAPDGNLYLSGGTFSAPGSGEVGPMAEGGALDFWLIKFDPASRSVLWDKRYGGTGEDFAYAICVSRTGNLYLGGRSASPSAPPSTENNGREATNFGGYSDFWMLELDAAGNKLREWSFGGSGLDDLYYIHETAQGRLVVGGVTDSGLSGNKTVPSRGGYDYWLICLEADGQPAWQQAIGGPGNEALTKIAQMAGGSFLFGGHSDGDAGFEKTEDGLGGNDFWLVATACDLEAGILRLNEAAICDDEPVELAVQIDGCDNCAIRWSNGATTETVELPGASGQTVWVEVWDELGCYASDTLVLEAAPPPAVELGPADTLIRQGDIISLGGGSAPDWTFAWSNGETTPSINVSEGGTYALTVTFPGGCTATDLIFVEVIRTSAVWVPNAFSPNNDGLNDYVNVYTDESVRRIVTFQIANRWGELVFRRDDYPPTFETDGWDGFWRGEDAGTGVFTWFTVVEFLDGAQQLFEGNVTVVR